MTTTINEELKSALQHINTAKERIDLSDDSEGILVEEYEKINAALQLLGSIIK